MRWFCAAAAVFTVALLLGHKYVPNTPGNAGSLLETFLPWLGLAAPALLTIAVLRRSWAAAAAAGLVAVVWLGMFGRLILPGKGGGEHNLRVLTHNVGASDPARTTRALLAEKADLVALEELEDVRAFARGLDEAYPYRVERGTVALWSRFPLAQASDVDIGMGWTRALRATVNAPGGQVAVYVAHLASVRVGESGFGSEQRDRTISELAQAIAAEKLPRVVVM